MELTLPLLLTVAYLALLFTTLHRILIGAQLSGMAKLVWAVLVIVTPLLGMLAFYVTFWNHPDRSAPANRFNRFALSLLLAVVAFWITMLIMQFMPQIF
jgi:hypothetical protein